MSSNVWRKQLRTAFIAAGIVTLLGVLYTAFIKQQSGRGFAFDLADVLFMWGLTLLCFSLIYVTRYFGYYDYMRKWFSFRPRQKEQADQDDEFKTKDHDDQEQPKKRDAALIYASLVVISLSFILALL